MLIFRMQEIRSSNILWSLEFVIQINLECDTTAVLYFVIHKFLLANFFFVKNFLNIDIYFLKMAAPPSCFLAKT